MRQRKRKQLTEKDAKKQLFLQASRDHALISDETLLQKWEETQNELKKFYAEEYSFVIKKNAELLTELNKLSISILNRNIFTEDQIKQSLRALDTVLKNCLEIYNER